MTDDAPELEIRSFLRRMADEVPPPFAAPPRLLRRARHRVAAKVGTGAVALALVLFAIASGVASLRGLGHRTPTDSGRAPATLETIARIEVSDAPMSMATGDGSVWVSHPLSISRIDASTDTVVQTVHVLSAVGYSSGGGASSAPGPCQAQGVCGGSASSDSLNRLAFGGGALWATSSDGGGRVFRIDPGTDQVTAAIDVPGAYDVAGGEEAVWVLGSAFGAGGILVRIDPATSGTVDQVSLDAEANAVAVGDGSVWVALDGGPVLRIDPVSLEVQRTYDVGVEGIHGLAFGEGALWAAADHEVVRLDPEGGGVVSTPVNNPQELAIGGGAVWVSAYSAQEVLEIDPRSGAIVSRAAVGNSPNGKAFFAGALWVVLDGENAVLRLEGPQD